MTEHSTSARGMNWDWGTGDICKGDRSPGAHADKTHSTDYFTVQQVDPRRYKLKGSFWFDLTLKTTQ